MLLPVLLFWFGLIKKKVAILAVFSLKTLTQIIHLAGVGDKERAGHFTWAGILAVIERGENKIDQV